MDGDLIIGCGAADGKITLDNVTVKGRLLVWGGGTKAVCCNNGTQMPEVVVARVDDAVKVIYDRDSTLAVIDTIKGSYHRTCEAAQGNGSHFLRRFRTARSPEAAQRDCRGQSDCSYCSCSSICSGRRIQRESRVCEQQQE